VRSCIATGPIADIPDIADIPSKPQTIADFSPNSAHYPIKLSNIVENASQTMIILGFLCLGFPM
jgi:hypothetical protein